MSPSPPPVPSSKIARAQRAANRSAGVTTIAPNSKSTSRKRLQSNADESANKRNKIESTDATDIDDTIMDAAIDVEEENEGKKGGKKGKKAKKTGGKGKNSYLSLLLSLSSIWLYLLLLVGRRGLSAKMKMKLRMLRGSLLSSRGICSLFWIKINYNWL